MPSVQPATRQPTVLHVNDAAFTAQRLIAEAARRGIQWDFMPKAAPTQEWTGVAGKARRAALGAAWVAKLAVQARKHDIVHVHSGTTLKHARPATQRFVLHCHGSDVRTAQYQPQWQKTIRDGLRDAEAVFYPTPDVAEHVLAHRADAVYIPIPIDVPNIPHWTPADGKPRVIFASRWGQEKGGDVQLEMAKAVVAAVGDRADVVGLDWGPMAPDAVAAGVRLVSRCDHPAFLKLLAESHVVIGQSAGILATSELETLGMGAPLVMPVPMPLYPTSLPFYGGNVSDGAQAVAALLDGSEPHDPSLGRKWIADENGIDHAVDKILEVHAQVMAARA